MRFSLILQGSGTDSHQYELALRLARAITQSEHQLLSVFFYEGAVQRVMRDDEYCVWQTVQAQTGTELLLCSQAAHRFDVTPSDGFEIAGLATLVDLSHRCDRLVSFG